MGRPKVDKKTCSIDGCMKLAWAKTYCGTHYRRYQRYGDPNFVTTNFRTKPPVCKHTPVENRLSDKYISGDINECWPWIKFKDKKGYGKVWDTTSSRPAHVVLYEHCIGEVPEGLELDHTCNYTSCVNPYHMEPVTTTENTRRRDERLGNPSHRARLAREEKK